MNRLVLQAQLVEKGAVRYTPAGLAAFDLSLKHESQVSQAGAPRKVAALPSPRCARCAPRLSGGVVAA